MSTLNLDTQAYLVCVAAGTWPADKTFVPQKIRESIERYVKHGLRTGGFLEAVLSNDLMDAFKRADRDDLVMMPTIIAYIYNDVPTAAHGSRDKYNAWLNMHRERLERETSVDKVNSET